MDEYIGEIRIFAGDFEPRRWAFCRGQLLSINQNRPLFKLIGIKYGGDGDRNFALPNLSGSIPVNQGAGSGLTQREVGDRFGAEPNKLEVVNLPAHNHFVQANMSAGSSPLPTDNIFSGRGKDDTDFINSLAVPPAIMDSAVVQETGVGDLFSNFQPSLPLHYITALEGIFPDRL